MQSVSSRIWTRVTVSISYDDNHYTTGTSIKFFIWLSILFLGVRIRRQAINSALLSRHCFGGRPSETKFSVVLMFSWLLDLLMGINNLIGFPTLFMASSSCSICDSVCLWALFAVILNHIRTGNCLLQAENYTVFHLNIRTWKAT